jgi:hypothetical protein
MKKIDKELLDKIIELIYTHSDHEGGYCDTGEDMEWQCRSECVDMAVKRLTDYFEVTPPKGS